MHKIFLSLVITITIFNAPAQSQKLEVAQDGAYRAFDQALHQHIGVSDLRNLIAGYVGYKFKRTQQMGKIYFNIWPEWELSPDGKYSAREYNQGGMEPRRIILVDDLHGHFVYCLADGPVSLKLIGFDHLGQLLSYSEDDNCLRSWLLPNSSSCITQKLGENIQSFDISPHDTKLCMVPLQDVTSGEKATVYLYDYKNDRETVVPIMLDNGMQLDKARYSGDGMFLYVLKVRGRVESCVTLYDLTQKQEIARFDTKDHVYDISPNPKRTGVLLFCVDQEYRYRLAIWSHAQHVDILPSKQFQVSLFKVQFSPDGNFIAVLADRALESKDRDLVLFDSQKFTQASIVLTKCNAVRDFKILSSKNSLITKRDESSSTSIIDQWDAYIDLDEQSFAETKPAKLPVEPLDSAKELSLKSSKVKSSGQVHVGVRRSFDPRELGRYRAILVIGAAMLVYYLINSGKLNFATIFNH